MCEGFVRRFWLSRIGVLPRRWENCRSWRGGQLQWREEDEEAADKVEEGEETHSWGKNEWPMVGRLRVLTLRRKVMVTEVLCHLLLCKEHRLEENCLFVCHSLHFYNHTLSLGIHTGRDFTGRCSSSCRTTSPSSSRSRAPSPWSRAAPAASGRPWPSRSRARAPTSSSCSATRATSRPRSGSRSSGAGPRCTWPTWRARRASRRWGRGSWGTGTTWIFWLRARGFRGGIQRMSFP